MLRPNTETLTQPQSTMIQQTVYSQLWTGHRTYNSSCMCHCAMPLCPFFCCVTEIHLLTDPRSGHDGTYTSDKIFKNNLLSLPGTMSLLSHEPDSWYCNQTKVWVRYTPHFILAVFHMRSTFISRDSFVYEMTHLIWTMNLDQGTKQWLKVKHWRGASIIKLGNVCSDHKMWPDLLPTDMWTYLWNQT